MTRGKPCRECGVWKPLAGFYRHPSTRDGRENICKVCKRVYEAERRVLKAPEIRAYRAEYERRPERIAARNARFRAYIKTPRGRESRRLTQRAYRAFKRATGSPRAPADPPGSGARRPAAAVLRSAPPAPARPRAGRP